MEKKKKLRKKKREETYSLMGGFSEIKIFHKIFKYKPHHSIFFLDFFISYDLLIQRILGELKLFPAMTTRLCRTTKGVAKIIYVAGMYILNYAKYT